MNSFHYCGGKNLSDEKRPKKLHVNIVYPVAFLSDSDVKRPLLTTAQLINSLWTPFVLQGRLYTLKLIYKDLC